VIAKLVGLALQFVGLALAFSSLSLAASGRSLTAWLAVIAGVITFLLGHRLLRAAASRP
jgi:O-antigen ligase